jgi:hypothetical protein
MDAGKSRRRRSFIIDVRTTPALVDGGRLHNLILVSSQGYRICVRKHLGC